MTESTRAFVVDRIEGDTAVLIEEGTGSTTNVAVSALPHAARQEGAFLRVPAGEPIDWSRATRDVAAEQHRRDNLQKRVQELGKTDKGGDVVL